MVFHPEREYEISHHKFQLFIKRKGYENYVIITNEGCF